MLRVWSSSGEELACMPLAQVRDVRTLKRHLRSTCGLPACFQKLFRIPSAVRKDLNDDLLSVFKSLGQAIDVQLVAVTCSDDTILSLEVLEAVRNSELSAARLLFEAGANTECRDPHGNTPLMLASANGHIQMLCFLLEAGARLNSQDHNQKTALNLAAAHGYAEIVSLLLEAGLDKDWQDVHGTTPLISACIAHHVKVVEVLLAAKASTDKIQQHGSTALMWASAKGHTRIVSLLLEARASTDEGGVDSTALIDAAINDNIDSVYLLLNARAAISSVDKHGKTALAWASSLGHDEVSDLLLTFESRLAHELRIRWQDPLADEDSITQQEREQSGSQGRAGTVTCEYYDPASLAMELYAMAMYPVDDFKMLRGGLLHLIGEFQLWWSAILNFTDFQSCAPRVGHYRWGETVARLESQRM
ncbi:unnamed protein product, partial [Symbiodinium microadriaticum]